MVTLIKKDKKLAQKARQIFGDIVKTAYISTNSFPDFDNKSNGDLEKELKQNSKILLYTEDNKTGTKSIHSDAQTIFIEFIGGRLVGFYNSEWGNIFLQTEKLKRV